MRSSFNLGTDRRTVPGTTLTRQYIGTAAEFPTLLHVGSITVPAVGCHKLVLVIETETAKNVGADKLRYETVLARVGNLKRVRLKGR